MSTTIKQAQKRYIVIMYAEVDGDMIEVDRQKYTADYDPDALYPHGSAISAAEQWAADPGRPQHKRADYTVIRDLIDQDADDIITRWSVGLPRETYSVVVESGSCDPTYTRWEEREHCGHAHKTIEAAERCMHKLTRWQCNHGLWQGAPCSHCLGGVARGDSTSAAWYNATIHNQDGERV